MLRALERRERDADFIKVGLVGVGAMGKGIAHQREFQSEIAGELLGRPVVTHEIR